MNQPQSQLARHQLQNPLDDAEMRAFAAMCWHQRGIPVFLDIEEIPLGKGRQAIISAAEQLYGERQAE